VLRYRFTCIDKLTGHTMKLCAEGDTEDEAASKIWDIGFLTSKCKLCPWVEDETLEPKMDDETWDLIYEHSGSGFISNKRLIGKVCEITFMQEDADTNDLLKLYNTRCDLIDRHSYLNQLVRIANRGKADPSFCSLLEMFCWQWIVERDEIAERVLEGGLPADKREYMYEVDAVNRLRILLDAPERAAQVCDIALSMKYPPQDCAKLQRMAIRYRKKLKAD
jgi:hypothetical protein